MSTVSYLPPPTIRLPAELRQAVAAAAGNDPQRRARLERHARRQWLEYGLPWALATPSATATALGQPRAIWRGGGVLQRLALQAVSR